MGGVEPIRPESPPLSPLISRDLEGLGSNPLRLNERSEAYFNMKNDISSEQVNEDGLSPRSHHSEVGRKIGETTKIDEGTSGQGPGDDLITGHVQSAHASPNSPKGRDLIERRGDTAGSVDNQLSNQASNREEAGTLVHNVVDPEGDHGDERDTVGDRSGGVSPTTDNGEGDNDGEGEEDDETRSGETSPTSKQGEDYYLDQQAVATRLLAVDEILMSLGSKSGMLEQNVKDLETSLEFSQHEITKLKKENADLKQLLGSIENEDRRTQYQVKKTEAKLEKLETVTKKKNLVFEGLPEVGGGREDASKTIGNLFDQLNINAEVRFDACFRLGPAYNNNNNGNKKGRPILVSFEKQADRDLVYSRRFDLRRTPDFKQVWINENISPEAKRKRGLIRLITKEAQIQGIDHKSGKYTISLGKNKYDTDNLEDLPCPLRPMNLKQMLIDDNTLAYQSEYAPFSNFFPCRIVIGSLRFTCLEQAYQFLKAKTMNKPLAATRIYLSREVIEMKQIGNDLGTSPEWEAKMFDVMYICLK